VRTCGGLDLGLHLSGGAPGSLSTEEGVEDHAAGVDIRLECRYNRVEIPLTQRKGGGDTRLEGAVLHDGGRVV